MSKRRGKKKNRARRASAAGRRAGVQRQHPAGRDRGEIGEEATARREQEARRLANETGVAWRETCVPKSLRDCIVKLCHPDGTIISKDTWINIKKLMDGLPDGQYHYVNDRTQSTQFFSVRGGVAWPIGAKMPDGTFVRLVLNIG